MLVNNLSYVLLFWPISISGFHVFLDELKIYSKLLSPFCIVFQQVLGHLLEEAGYTKESSLLLDDFIKVLIAS